jgi:mRNA interferase HigB
VRVIKVPFLEEAARKFPKARKWIESWCSITKEVQWKNIQEVRASYPSADTVAVGSGNNVVVFNVCGNDYRLIVAIHYNRGIVYTLRFLTHVEYSKDKWKKEL